MASEKFVLYDLASKASTAWSLNPWKSKFGTSYSYMITPTNTFHHRSTIVQLQGFGLYHNMGMPQFTPNIRQII